jgi:hypothetical protein
VAFGGLRTGATQWQRQRRNRNRVRVRASGTVEINKMRSRKSGVWTLLLGATIGGVWWITNRRGQVAAAEGKTGKSSGKQRAGGK